MSATVRLITVDFNTILNGDWALARMRVTLLTAVAIDNEAVHPVEHTDFVAGADGTGSLSLAVPATGAWNYTFRLPDNNSYIVPVGAGGSVTLASLLAAAFPPADNPTLDEYYVRKDGGNAKTGNYPNWRFWIQPQTIVADEVIVIPDDHQMVVFGGLAIEAGGQLIIEAGGALVTPS